MSLFCCASAPAAPNASAAAAKMIDLRIGITPIGGLPRGTRPCRSRRRQSACIRSVGRDFSWAVGHNVDRAGGLEARAALETMRISTERILTTHVGSLPRSAEVVELLYKKDAGEPFDRLALDAAVAAGVAD